MNNYFKRLLPLERRYGVVESYFQKNDDRFKYHLAILYVAIHFIGGSIIFHSIHFEALIRFDTLNINSIFIKWFLNLGIIILCALWFGFGFKNYNSLIKEKDCTKEFFFRYRLFNNLIIYKTLPVMILLPCIWYIVQISMNLIMFSEPLVYIKGPPINDWVILSFLYLILSICLKKIR